MVDYLSRTPPCFPNLKYKASLAVEVEPVPINFEAGGNDDEDDAVIVDPPSASSDGKKPAATTTKPAATSTKTPAAKKPRHSIDYILCPRKTQDNATQEAWQVQNSIGIGGHGRNEEGKGKCASSGSSGPISQLLDTKLCGCI